MSKMWLIAVSVLSFAVVGLPGDLPNAVAQSANSSAQSRRPLLAAAEDSEALVRIRGKLADPVTLEFVETPLDDVIQFLKDYTGLNIVLDRRALEQVGITRDTLVSIHVQSITLASALNHLLRQHGLAWSLQDDCLVITSKAVADGGVVTRAYRVDDLAATPDDGARLTKLVTQVLTSAGGMAAERLAFLDSLKALVLTDNRSAHSLLERLLQELRGETVDPDTVKKIKARLADPVTLEFVETPLSDVVGFLKDYTGVNIIYDRAALDEQGVTSDTPVSIHVQGIALRSGLKLLLDSLELTFKIEDECLMITSKRAEQGQFELRVYSVGKVLAGGQNVSPDEWRRVVRSFAVPAVREEREKQPDTSQAQVPQEKNAGARPLIEFYEPNQCLVVFGPNSLHDKTESATALVAKTADQPAKQERE